MRKIAFIVLTGLLLSGGVVHAQQHGQTDTIARELTVDSMAVEADTLVSELIDVADGDEAAESGSLHKQLKRKFMEGSAGFMSLVALSLVLGLAFCVERIVFLSLSEINARKLMSDVDRRLQQGDVAGARELCRNTRGPVASIAYQGLLHIAEPLEQIDRQLTNYGSLLVSQMERGCSWIRLFIAVAPSLGFLGTVIGMVMAFDQIQMAGDISPTIVAKGMKVALITTIFGIIVAIILQFFYNYILSRIERLTMQMEEGAITLMDSIGKVKGISEKGKVKGDG